MSFNELFLVGSIISDRYEILKPLGEGGGGRVYLALDRKMANAPRAIKQLAVEYIDYDQYTKAIEDFKREVKVLSDLEHPSIPTVYDYFTASGYYFLVMKYVGGKTLEQILIESPDGRLPERTVTQWGIQLCDTLAYIHGLNPPIIYRDMKPANVMYDESSDQVVLIDFGIARYVQSSMELVTAIGTVGYAPPELFQGRVSPASDIYSLGASMFRLLTGTVPSNNPLKGFDYSTNPRPSQINDKITKTMEDILVKAVEVKPENRFASAREMKSALEKHLAELDNPPNKEEAINQTLNYPPKSWNSLGPAFESKNARLVIYCKTKKIAEFYIAEQAFLIGRFDEGKGVIPDLDLTSLDRSGKISRKHARITWERGNFYFEDLGSSNGSTYKGQKIAPHQRVLLQNGDYVGMGEMVMEFILG